MTDSPETLQFVDTNILVYAYDRTAGHKHTIASQLVAQWWENENGCLSLQVLQEFYVTITRKIANPLDLSGAKTIIADLAHWRLHLPDASDLLRAIDFQQNYQLSFWDAMIVQSASRLGCQQLLTEGLQHERLYGPLQVINPFGGGL